MIRLGLRLTVSGGREAIIRLVILAAAVGMGVGLLLTAIAAVNAVNVQNDRYAWLDTAPTARSVTPSRDPLWGRVTADQFNGQAIDRVDVAASGPTSPVPPGIPRDPGPGSVLCFARAQHAAARHASRPARRPLSGTPGRDHR